MDKQTRAESFRLLIAQNWGMLGHWIDRHLGMSREERDATLATIRSAVEHKGVAFGIAVWTRLLARDEVGFRHLGLGARLLVAALFVVSAAGVAAIVHAVIGVLR